MNCTRCLNEIEKDTVAKLEILDELFGVQGSRLCGSCHENWVERLKGLWHRLTCQICWKYHNWQDFKQWLKIGRNTVP
jgi:hypothetical protein